MLKNLICLFAIATSFCFGLAAEETENAKAAAGAIILQGQKSEKTESKEATQFLAAANVEAGALACDCAEQNCKAPVVIEEENVQIKDAAKQANLAKCRGCKRGRRAVHAHASYLACKDCR